LKNIGLILFDIDGVIRSVENSYRLSLKKTVYKFSGWEPTYIDIDNAKNEGIWKNDWDLSLELIKRCIKKENLNLDKLNYLSDLYLKPLINKNIEELILGCSHYPLIYDFLRKKLDSNIKIIDPSVALIKKFNESFNIPETDRYESISFENVKFFVTSERDDFSNKVKFWLGINKEIRLVNLRSNV